MYNRSRSFCVVLSVLILLVGGAWAQAGTIQGEVKGPDGKPAGGAEIQIEQSNSKQAAKTVRADQKGRYLFEGLAVGTYKVTAWVNKVPTSVSNVKSRSIGATRVDFDIKPTAAAAAKATTGKKAKHFVWIPSETGSHLGGRWVEVDADGSGSARSDDMDKVSGQALRNLRAPTRSSRGNGF